MGNNRNPRVIFSCDSCGIESSDKPSHYKRKKLHFCSMKCYAKYRKDVMPPDQQNSWRGGFSSTETHRRWKEKNRPRMRHLKSLRYARERNAEGSHTLTEWEEMKDKNQHQCAICKELKPLTKDHIIPLSKGGSNYITNIQPLCRNCNSKKHNKNIHENPELLTPNNQ